MLRPIAYQAGIRHAPVLVAFILCGLCVSAQEEAGPAGAAEPAPESSEPRRVPAPKGDVVRFKWGQVLRGVQVLRGDTTYYYIEMYPGLEPLEIPRKHVESVEYDDVDLIKERRRRGRSRKSSPVRTLQGQSLDPGLLEKLNKPLSSETLSLGEGDLLALLSRLGSLAGVSIEIHPSVKEMSQEERRWSLKARPKATLASVLRENLLKSFDNLEVLYHYDKVLITTKEASLSAEQAVDPKT